MKFEISARHIHLSRTDCIKLFGTDELHKRNNLSEPGEFASDEVVEIAGPEGSLHRVRVLGPFREKTQLELSMSDTRHLGVEAPLALSGSGIGCDIKIIGPKGNFIAPVAMVAKRHFHLNTHTAAKYKLRQGNQVKMKVFGERGTIFENVIVRISDKYRDIIHLDTDEGNAAGGQIEGWGELILK